MASTGTGSGQGNGAAPAGASNITDLVDVGLSTRVTVPVAPLKHGVMYYAVVSRAVQAWE
jgi:hypothetical protein